VSTPSDVLRARYRQMVLIRRFEEASAKAYSQGKIGGFLHLYIGQEASAVGALGALQPQDYVSARTATTASPSPGG
jgi:pyruvate dehydrogenase E1 component alpha subunit